MLRRNYLGIMNFFNSYIMRIKANLARGFFPDQHTVHQNTIDQSNYSVPITELLKLPGVGRIDFSKLKQGTVETTYNALDPLWGKAAAKEDGMVPLHDHMRRLYQATTEIAQWSSDWEPVSENLHLAASLTDLFAHTDLAGDSMWCRPAADFKEADTEVAEKYLASVIVFNLVWISYESAVELISKRFSFKQQKGALGREIIASIIEDRHFPYIRKTVLDALDFSPKGHGLFQSAEMRRMLKSHCMAGIGAEHLRIMRNSIIHGDLSRPLPEDWGKDRALLQTSILL